MGFKGFNLRHPTVKSSNCSAACPTNMSRPLACVQPAAAASSQGLSLVHVLAQPKPLCY